MSPFELLILALATWRLAFMLVREDGPGDVFLRLRQRRLLLGLFGCVYCMSVWTAGVMLVLWAIWPLTVLVYVLAISGAALMLQSFSGVQHVSG
jgi:hypothetical protein